MLQYSDDLFAFAMHFTNLADLEVRKLRIYTQRFRYFTNTQTTQCPAAILVTHLLQSHRQAN